MRYGNCTEAVFLQRPNRFVAVVQIGDRQETVHVKNTGRCKELLLPGAQVYLTAPGTPNRKTVYDLVAVRKQNGLLINIDSQAPNLAVKEWLQGQGVDAVRPEVVYGASRIDFYFEKAGRRCLLEVKGCTLEVDGMGYFPDAPTERGVRHLEELMRASAEGYDACLAFVIQMDGITRVLPNRKTDPAFGEAIDRAQMAGVRVLYLPCHVRPDGFEITTKETLF